MYFDLFFLQNLKTKVLKTKIMLLLKLHAFFLVTKGFCARPTNAPLKKVIKITFPH